jgi:hypothetical protein
MLICLHKGNANLRHLGIIKTNVMINIFNSSVMVFNANFNNISVISWRSVLLVEETGVPGENHRLVVSHWQTLSHNVVENTPLPWGGFELTTLLVIGTDNTGSWKTNYHTITTTKTVSDEGHGIFTYENDHKNVQFVTKPIWSLPKSVDSLLWKRRANNTSICHTLSCTYTSLEYSLRLVSRHAQMWPINLIPKCNWAHLPTKLFLLSYEVKKNGK